jgi:hypothetical protein
MFSLKIWIYKNTSYVLAFFIYNIYISIHFRFNSPAYRIHENLVIFQ